jgi:hypothetical protein
MRQLPARSLIEALEETPLQAMPPTPRRSMRMSGGARALLSQIMSPLAPRSPRPPGLARGGRLSSSLWNRSPGRSRSFSPPGRRSSGSSRSPSPRQRSRASLFSRSPVRGASRGAPPVPTASPQPAGPNGAARTPPFQTPSPRARGAAEPSLSRQWSRQSDATSEGGALSYQNRDNTVRERELLRRKASDRESLSDHGGGSGAAERELDVVVTMRHGARLRYVGTRHAPLSLPPFVDPSPARRLARCL